MTDQTPSTFDPLVLRRAFGNFPTGVTVVTAAPDGEPLGMTVGSFFSVSLDPPLVGLCADKASSSWPRIAPANCFAVNILAADQADVSSRFASRDDDKFAGIAWRPSAHTGSPLLDQCIGWVDCVTEQTVESGDHWIVIGRVVGIEVERQADPLVFFRGGYGSFAPLT
jgi:3-hydroxy-9,10-secoandrosta-1,3,5(10)-triene-9,17-dione monooxygenase reductase component